MRLTAVLGIYLDAYLDDIAQVVTFLGEIDRERRPNPDEVSEVRWFGADELPSALEFVPGHVDRLQDWARIRRGLASLALGILHT